jgi:hypothetical protein
MLLNGDFLRPSALPGNHFPGEASTKAGDLAAVVVDVVEVGEGDGGEEIEAGGGRGRDGSEWRGLEGNAAMIGGFCCVPAVVPT